MFRWWHRWQDRKRLAQLDAKIMIARFGVRATYMARRRVVLIQNGEVFDSNRPSCHWKRVHSLVRQLLPYDGEDGEIAAPSRPDSTIQRAASNY